MSLFHQELYSNNNVKEIDFNEYLVKLISHIKSMNEKVVQKINFNLHVKEFTFPINTAVPLGLILNELISNAYKHAFEGKKEGNISVNVLQTPKTDFTLTVADDGIGLQKNKNTNTLGLSLVEILSNQIGGSINYKVASATTYYIKFKNNIAI